MSEGTKERKKDDNNNNINDKYLQLVRVDILLTIDTLPGRISYQLNEAGQAQHSTI